MMALYIASHILPESLMHVTEIFPVTVAVNSAAIIAIPIVMIIGKNTYTSDLSKQKDAKKGNIENIMAKIETK